MEWMNKRREKEENPVEEIGYDTRLRVNDNHRPLFDGMPVSVGASLIVLALIILLALLSNSGL